MGLSHQIFENDLATSQPVLDTIFSLWEDLRTFFQKSSCPFQVHDMLYRFYVTERFSDNSYFELDLKSVLSHSSEEGLFRNYNASREDPQGASQDQCILLFLLP